MVARFLIAPVRGATWFMCPLMSLSLGACLGESTTSRECVDCVEITPLVTLGTLDGPGALESPSAILVDRLGRFWVGQRGSMMVFDAEGRFQERIGRSGEGPMEFSRPLPVRLDDDGGVHVVDPGNRRVSVIDPQFSLEAQWPLPSTGGVRYLAPLPNARDEYAVNIWAPSMQAIGFPLHVIRRDTILASFGAPDSVVQMNDFTSLRIMAVDTTGNIVVSKRFDHTLDVWSRDGELMYSIVRPPLNDHEVKWGAYNLDDNPLANEVLSLHVDDANRAWVLTRRVHDSWREHVEETTMTGGLRGIRTPPEKMDSIYFSRIEVVDLTRRAVVGHVDVQELLADFLNSGDVFGHAMTAEGAPLARVFDLEWKN